MKAFKLSSLIIFSACIFLSCSGNNNANAGKASAGSNTATVTASSSGNASFSCKIDGRDFSENKNDT